jgi:hypothetical protein
MKLQRQWIALLVGVLYAVNMTREAEAANYQMNIKSMPEAGNKCVSTPDGQFVEGMRVFIWDCNAPLAQTLSYDDQTQQLKFGVHCVQALGPGKPRDAVAVGTCNGSASQRWSMAPVQDSMRLVTRVDGSRIRLLESGPLTGPFAGQKNIVAGKAANGGAETRWLKRCQ